MQLGSSAGVAELEERQDHPAAHRAQQRDPNLTGADGEPNRRGQPDRRRRCQACDLLLISSLEDGSGTQESNAGRNALNHPSEIPFVQPNLSRHDFELFLLDNGIISLPQTPARFEIRVHNVGTDITTYNVGVSNKTAFFLRSC